LPASNNIAATVRLEQTAPMFIRGSIRLGVLVIASLCGFALRAQTNTAVADAAPRAGRDGVQIPAGTILPVRLSRGFSSKNARAGQEITGRLMQDVPLTGSDKIPEGSKVIGTILSVSAAGSNNAGRITFQFTQIEIHHRRMAMVTNLRAIASPMEVQFAQIPETSPGFGTPYTWATTDQIGGDVKYGVGGPVTDRGSQVVGEGTYDGVLVHVRAQVESGCRGEQDDNYRLQALWVFSADSCGVYGMAGARIVHAGRTTPIGEITLSADSGDANVRSGSGMLLRVVR
jgi:hypothetical protein